MTRNCFTGDYNLNMLKHDKHIPTETYLDVMYANSFISGINRNTRVTMCTFTLMDNIFTIIVMSKNINYMKSRKQTLLIIFCHFISIAKNPDIINNEHKVIQIINEARIIQYVSQIHNINWSVLHSFGQYQSYVSNFLRGFAEIYEESFPLNRVKNRHRRRFPRLSDGLKASIKHRRIFLLNRVNRPRNRFPWLSDGLKAAIKQQNTLYLV